MDEESQYGWPNGESQTPKWGGSCKLLWKLADALIVQMVVEVVILNQDFVEVLVDHVDVE
jgi:hypothetical protein